MFSFGQIFIKIVLAGIFLYPLISAILNIKNSKRKIFNLPYFGISLKTSIIASYCLIYLLAIISVWNQYVDLKGFTNIGQYVEREVESKSSWLPVREKDALYQDGIIVARVSGVKKDSVSGEIYFEEIYKSESFRPNQEFEFMNYKLTFKGAESRTDLHGSRPLDGRIYTKVRCKIIKK